MNNENNENFNTNTETLNNNVSPNLNEGNVEIPAPVVEPKPIEPVSTPETVAPAAPTESTPVAEPTPVAESTPVAEPTQVENTVGTNVVKPIPVSEAPKAEEPNKEVGTVMVGKPMSNIIKPIAVGDIQGSGATATIGGGEPTIVTKKKDNIFVVIFLILAIIGLFGYMIWTYLLKDKVQIGSVGGGLNGIVSENSLVYKTPKEGDKITFTVTNNLKLIVTISKIEVQEGVGSKVYYSIKEADGKDSISPTYTWLEDDGSLKINLRKSGSYALFELSSDSDLAIISGDGTITNFSDMSSFLSEEKGLKINTYDASETGIQFVASRVSGSGVISYGDLKEEYNDEIEDVFDYIGDGVSICRDTYKQIPETTTVSATFTFTLANDVIDLTKPEVTDKVDITKYATENHDLLCQ